MNNFIKASDFCDHIFDGTHDSPKQSESGNRQLVTSKHIINGDIVPPVQECFISEEDYQKIQKRSAVHANDVLFSMIGTIGRMAFITYEPEWAIKNIGVFRCADINKALWIYYYMNHPYAKYHIEKSKRGTTQKFFSLDKMKNFPILEPHERYIDVVQYLSLLDNQIHNNLMCIDTIQELIRTIYQYWFLQFDFPNENGDPYRQSGGEMIFNEELQQEIPVGWEVASVSSNRLCSGIKNGISKYDGEKEYLATGDVNGITITPGEFTTYANRKSRANMEPMVYSVWFAKMKSSIKHLLLNSEMESFVNDTILSTGFFGLQCSEESFEYIASYIHCSNFEVRKDKIAHGVTQKAVNETDISHMRMIVPPDEIVKQYHEYTKSMFSMISQMINENKQLDNLRDYLLPLLMSGQVKIETDNDDNDEEE